MLIQNENEVNSVIDPAVSFRIRSKLVKHLTARQVTRCLDLSLGEEGGLHAHLPYQRSHPALGARAVLLIDKDGEIAAWALLYRHKGFKKYHLNVFVPEHLRRQGHGTRLVRHSFKFHNKPKCTGWDLDSIAFFETFGKDVVLVDA